ncbi:MAG TPA: hypothetical protein VK961_10775 [Chthoniobacter sp.]|nr:hypothetical protein [Chthoniobacter sp.]
MHIQEIPLIEEDEEALALIRQLRERGYDPETVAGAMRRLEPIAVTRIRQRQASRAALDTRVQTEVGRILVQRGINHQGRHLDRQRRGRTNFVVLKSAIDRHVNTLLGVGTGERSELSQEQLDDVNTQFDALVARAVTEVFGA